NMIIEHQKNVRLPTAEDEPKHISCPMCRELILDLPIFCSTTWNALVDKAKIHWSAYHLRTHLRTRRKHWNKHVVNNAFQRDWGFLLIKNWEEKLRLYYEESVHPNFEEEIPMPRVKREAKLLVDSKLRRYARFVPVPELDL